MRAPLYGLTIPLLLLTAAFLGTVPQVSAQDVTYHTITGRVLDDTGAPLEGVHVNAYTYPSSDPMTEQQKMAVRNVETITDANGAYTLKLPEGKGWINVYYEKWRQSDGREFALDGDTSLDFTLKTPPPKDAAIDGIVVDVNGDPIPGAEVTLSYGCCYAMPVETVVVDSAPAEGNTTETSSGSGSYATSDPAISSKPSFAPPYYDDYQTVITGKDGRFHFDAYAGPRTITASAKGFAQTTVQVTAASDKTVETTVKLEKVPPADAAVSGRVTDAKTGKPLANAQVNLRSLEWGRYSYAQTDADGKFSFKTLPGWAEISVNYYPSYGEPVAMDTKIAIRANPQEYFPYSDLVKLKSGDNTLNAPLDPKPKPTIALIGYVVDPETKKAIADVHVNVWSQEGGEWGEAITDATGSYKIMVREGHYMASAYKENYLSASQTFIVDGGPTERFDIMLPAGTTKWAPCDYEVDQSCGGPIMYSRDATAEGTQSSPPMDTKATSTGAPGPAPGLATTGGNAATLAADNTAGNAANGPDKSKGASFEGTGGGLPPYDAASTDSVPESDSVKGASNVPGLGLLGLLGAALAGAIVLARRRK